ncbi:MAG TPA: TPM domain-containing protein, partial [Pyrinomonadaceae bacterium]|nr:TPM domain-containing protein [Pyrinomonadaceae bacterium]
MPNQTTLQTHDGIAVAQEVVRMTTYFPASGDDSEQMRSPFHNRRALVVATMLVVLCAVLTARSHAGAQETRLAKRAGHINDFAEVLDAPTKERLEAVLEKLKDKTHFDFVVATIKTAGKDDLYDYSLAVANDWKVGAPASSDKSLLIVIAADNGRFFSQVTRGARIYLPEGLVGEMGQRIREKIGNGGYSTALMTGVRVFIDRLGEIHNFDFAALDVQRGEDIAQAQRPRTVQSPVAEPSANPRPTPAATETVKAEPTATPTPAIEARTEASATVTPSVQSTPTPEPSVTASAVPVATSSPSAAPVQTPSPVESPSATAASSSSPARTPSPVESPSQTPTESVTSQSNGAASPEATKQTPAVARNTPRTLKTGAPERKPAAAAPMSPEDELEQVELTQTLPAEKRIDVLKDWIATHSTSTALPRAKELLVVAHAQFAGQRMQAGELEKGLAQFRHAVADATVDMPDRLFTEVLVRIPISLYSSGQRDAAFEIAHSLEPLAKSNGRRLAALSEFYLSIENAADANRLAELAVQMSPDVAAAHQALAAARHIDLRLDDAESEYAKALALDPKSNATRIALADLKRASGKNEEALALYRELLAADARSNRARAGLILSLLELGKKDEGEAELNKALQDKDQSHNLPLLVGAAYWFMAHNNP